MKHPDLGRLRRASASASASDVRVYAIYVARVELPASDPRPIPNDSATPNASLVGGMACGVLAIAELVLEPREDSPQ